MAESKNGLVPAMPRGLLGGVSPSTGPGRTANDVAIKKAKAAPIRSSHLLHRVSALALGKRATRATTRKTIGMSSHVATHAANEPNGRSPARVTKAYRAYDEAKSVSPRMKVMPHKIHPIRFAGRLVTTSAPTIPKPSQDESQSVPSSAVSGTCVVEMGGFLTDRRALMTIATIATTHIAQPRIALERWFTQAHLGGCS